MGINTIAIVKLVGSRIANTIRQRILKVQVFGKSDVREAQEAMPFGVDCNPVDGWMAIYADTSINGQPVIVGYVNQKLLAAQGEVRLFSTNSDGDFQSNVWCRANGDILIGDSSTPLSFNNNFVKWTQFNTVLQAYLVAQNAAIATALTGLGGAYTPPTAPNFTAAKTTKIKTT